VAVQVLFALELNASLVEVALISMVGGILNAILQIPFGMLGDRYGRKILILYPEVASALSSVARGFRNHAVPLNRSEPFGVWRRDSGLVATIGI